MSESKVGEYCFVVGVIIALIVGIISPFVVSSALAWLTSILVILGIIVGMIHIPRKDTKDFLLLAAVLIIATGLGSATVTLANVKVIGMLLFGIFMQVLAFVIPATIMVAIRGMLDIASGNPGKKK